MTLPAFGRTTSVGNLALLLTRVPIYPLHLVRSADNTMLDELGNWRPERNKFTRRYFQAYHSHIPKAEPEEDYDDRNALYSLYVVHADNFDNLTYSFDLGDSICTLQHCFPTKRHLFACKFLTRVFLCTVDRKPNISVGR